MMLTDAGGKGFVQARAEIDCFYSSIGKASGFRGNSTDPGAGIIWKHVHSQVLQLITAEGWDLFTGCGLGRLLGPLPMVWASSQQVSSQDGQVSKVSKTERWITFPGPALGVMLCHFWHQIQEEGT